MALGCWITAGVHEARRVARVEGKETQEGGGNVDQETRPEAMRYGKRAGGPCDKARASGPCDEMKGQPDCHTQCMGKDAGVWTSAGPLCQSSPSPIVIVHRSLTPMPPPLLRGYAGHAVPSPHRPPYVNTTTHQLH